jgi:hypothetical protein
MRIAGIEIIRRLRRGVTQETDGVQAHLQLRGRHAGALASGIV